MGNCIHTFPSPSQNNVKILTFDGKKKEFPASTMPKNITCGHYNGYKLLHASNPKQPLPPDAELVPGEVYYLVPPLMQQQKSKKMAMNNKSGYNGKRVKIVLNKQQLKLLVKNAVVVQSGEVALNRGFFHKKWRPSLATIPEF